MIRVSALYVDLARGPYPGMDGVDCFGWATRDGSQLALFEQDRDADTYPGPYPVVAHPPCGPWGRFWWNYKGGEGTKDSGLAAVSHVQNWGGVLEHPVGSKLWIAAGLPVPGDSPDRFSGFTIQVNQSDWGHPCRKPTWLYIVGCSVGSRPAPQQPSHVMVRLKRNGNDLPELRKKDRHLTPKPFALWLVDIARTYDG